MSDENSFDDNLLEDCNKCEELFQKRELYQNENNKKVVCEQCIIEYLKRFPFWNNAINVLTTDK